MFCDKCGTEIVEGQTQCPNCGADALTVPKPKKINPIFHVILGVLIVAVVAGIGTMLITTRVVYKAQDLDTTPEDAAAVTKVEVKSPNIQQVNLSIVSTTASESAVESEDSQAESEYIFADSNTRYLEKDEISALSKEDMRIARNEIYARHGRKFTDEALQEYFNSKSWYTPTYEPEEFDAMGDKVFNEYEYANKNLISEVEAELGYN